MVRQYFHKGLLWRASDIEEVASYELFVDLLYVGIIAIVGDNAAENSNGFGLLRFAITFIIGWKMWSDLTLVISWFGMCSLTLHINVIISLTRIFLQRQVYGRPSNFFRDNPLTFSDDIFQRLWVMFEMICLFGYTLNIVNSFDTTWTQLIAFYVCTLFPCSAWGLHYSTVLALDPAFSPINIVSQRLFIIAIENEYLIQAID